MFTAARTAALPALRATARAASTAASGRLAGKSIVVTGGANGIGAAMVEKFCAEGAKVVAADLDEEAGAALTKRIQNSRFLKIDASSEAEAKRLMEEAARLHGGVDALVNNAAAFVFGTVSDTTDAMWEKVLAVNVKGYAFMIKHAIPHMKRRGGGAVVNIASISGLSAQGALAPYATSKGAVLQMTRSVALDSASMNIRANAICPGMILTHAVEGLAKSQGQTPVRDIFSGTRPGTKPAGHTIPAQPRVQEQLFDSMMGHHIAIKRMGKPSEIANAAAFLLSDEASYITGTTLVVDGGFLIA